MNPFEVFDQVFYNLPLFLILTITFVFLLYFSVRDITSAGYFDPLHFVWTFTYGTAYALVAGLYFLGFIYSFYVLLVFLSGLLFIISFRFFIAYPSYNTIKLIIKITKPKVSYNEFFIIILLLYLVAVVYQVSLVGFGMFASTNRFEQARGNGAVIRFLAAITPFIIAGSAISLYNLKSRNGLSLKLVFFVFLLFAFVVFNAILDGSKIAVLTYIYSAILGLALYTLKKPKFHFFKIFFFFIGVLFFALLVQSFDLKNQNLDASRAQYLPEKYFPIERLIFRLIGNGDKYYLGLPNAIVEEIEIDSVAVRFIAPLVGTTNLSKILDYNVNNYDVGRQITLYHSQGRETAGGATSHFDLFSYKYFSIYFSWIWVVITAFILSIFIKIRRFSYGDIYIAAIGAQLWQSSLSILIEPPIGVAKILDVLIIFGIVKVALTLAPKRTHKNSITGTCREDIFNEYCK